MDDRLDDSQLVDQAKSGDADALGTLHDRHWQAIFTYIFYRVNDQFTAEDLASDVFVRMVKSIDNYRNQNKSIMPWLYTIARNLITDYYRKNKHEEYILPLKEDILADDNNPEEDVSTRIKADCLRKALRHLTEIQQQVIVGKFIEGRRNREIAERTGRTEGAVKALQHRALGALRRAIDKEKCYE